MEVVARGMARRLLAARVHLHRGTVSAAIVRLGDRRSTSSLGLIVMAASSSGVRLAPICGEEERRNHLEEERGGYKCGTR